MIREATLVLFVGGLWALTAGQPKSALEFYDTTGATATARFGWKGAANDGRFYIETPVGSEAVGVQDGALTVHGEIHADAFEGDGSGLTNLPEPADLQQKLSEKADTGHSHTLSEVAPDGIGTTDIQDDAVTGTKIRNGSIADADIRSNARISGSKIRPDFGEQEVRLRECIVLLEQESSLQHSSHGRTGRIVATLCYRRPGRAQSGWARGAFIEQPEALRHIFCFYRCSLCPRQLSYLMEHPRVCWKQETLL